MAQKYIVGDVVMYDNKIMVIKEPRDRSHFNLSCPKEGLVYCFVSVEDMKPVPLTPEILYKTFKRKGYPTIKVSQDLKITCELSPFIVKLESVSDLQHLLFGLELNSEMEV